MAPDGYDCVINAAACYTQLESVMNFNSMSRLSFLCILAIALWTSGCASTGDSPQKKTRADDDQRSPGSEIQADRSANEATVEDLLEGRISGLSVVQTSNGVELRIRGNRSFRDNNRPLVVINGAPVSEGYGGAIPVNPYDIKSVKVLKNALETAFYGARGRNGVILIETKRGN